MSKARLVLTALFIDHQSPSEVAARYGVHRSWVYKLKGTLRSRGRHRVRAQVQTAQDITNSD